MVDGYRLNDPIYGQGSIGLEFPVEVDLIERVEFVPGPGSAIYGSNAFFGVVNVITRKGKGVGGFEVAGEVASYDTFRGILTYGQRLEGDLDVLVSVSGYSSRGKNQHYAEFESSTSDGVARGLDYERAPAAFGKISWRGFTFEAAHRVRTKGVPTASFQSIFNDPREQTRDEQSLAELRYNGYVAKDLELSVRANHGSYDYRGYYPYADSATGSAIVNVDRARSKWWGSEVKLLSRAFDGHKIVLGTEYQNNTRKDQQNYDLDPPAVYMNQHHSSTQWGVYVQDEMPLRPDLSLNAGLRLDHYSTFGSISNPRLALIYSVDPSVTLKALYGRAYRAPNDGELFFSSEPLGWKSNPALVPERIATKELVAEWRLASLTRATLSGFHYKISDLITLTTDPSDGFQTYANQGSAHATGLQGEIEWLWRNGSALRTSYSFQRASDQSGARLVNSPRHLAKLDGTVPLAGDQLRAGLSLRYVSSRVTRGGAEVGSYGLADLTLTSERLISGAEISASIYNVFDRRYSDPVSDAHLQETIRQDGRTFRLKLIVRF
jgi:iron complex outermembrane receptor protein